jgi:hypothetical protein
MRNYSVRNYGHMAGLRGISIATAADHLRLLHLRLSPLPNPPLGSCSTEDSYPKAGVIFELLVASF